MPISMRTNLMEEIESRMDALRRDLMGDLRLPGSLAMPAVDVEEEADRFVVTADLPGYAKQDVRVEVDDAGLWIRAARERESEEKKARFVRRERRSAAYERYLQLPEAVSPDGVRASYRDGVLSVTIPKAAPENRRRRQIEID